MAKFDYDFGKRVLRDNARADFDRDAVREAIDALTYPRPRRDPNACGACGAVGFHAPMCPNAPSPFTETV